MKKIKKYKLKLQNSQGAVKYSTGSIVNNIVITMYGAKCALDLWGGSPNKLYNWLTSMLYT